MNIYAPIILCFIPLIAVFLIFALAIPEIKIRYELCACLAGLISVLPITFIQYFVFNYPVFQTESFFSVLITALVFTGLVEETIKMLCMLLLPYKNTGITPYFTYALLSGLALGCFESVIYFLQALQKAGSTGTELVYGQIFLRMGTSVLTHTFCAGLSGLTMYSIRKKKTNIVPYIYSFLLHGFYDFFTASSSEYHWIAIVSILFSASQCRMWYTTMKSENKKQNNSIKV